MSDESVLAPEADPVEVITEEKAAPTEVEQAAEGEDTPEDVEKKSAAAKRRERDKANRDRLRAELETATKAKEEAEARHAKLLEAGKSDKAPTADEYPDPIEHAAALAVWKQTQRVTQRETEEASATVKAAQAKAEEIAKAEQAELAKGWQVAVAEAKTRYADFDAVALSPTLPVSPAVASMIAASEQGADVLYHLGQNPALAAAISQLNPVQAAMALGRIEGQLSAPKPRTQSKAPDPINPARGPAAPMRDPDKMSPAEYRAWRAAGGTFKL